MTALSKFQALANATRFDIVQLVREREMDAGSIAGRFQGMTRPAVSQHLNVLLKAGLLSERRSGARRFYVVKNSGFDELARFVQGFWQPRLLKLKAAAEKVERGRLGR